MAFFNLTTPTTVPQTINDGEAGIVGTAASIQVFGTAVTMNGTSYLMTDGLIVGFGHAVDARNTIKVEITVGANGTIMSNGQAIEADVTESTRIVNHGNITGTVNALRLTANVEAEVGVDHEVVNTGYLASTSNGPSATVLFETDNVGFIEFSNSGVVSSTSNAIDNSATDTGFTLVRNTGQILAGQEFVPSRGFAYLGGSSIDYLINQGQISGAVNLGAGNDRYIGAGGHVSGLIDGGPGNDTLTGGAQSDTIEGGDDPDLILGRDGDDVLTGGLGFDRILGGEGNDEIGGGTANDTLSGQGGDDTINGDNGNDLIAGQDGNDLIDGGARDDTVEGGNGDDTINGGAGEDILRGGDGADVIRGGTGRDVVTGGGDPDEFIFATEAEAGLGAARDVIIDFTIGEDVINVAAMIGPVFDFIGTTAFTAANQVRLIETGSGSTIVQFNTDADLAAEAEIRVADVTGLTADDFVL